MHRRHWEAKTNACIGLEGWHGQSGAALCHDHQLSQSQSFQWCDQCLAQAAHVCEAHQHTRTEARFAQENARLKTLVGELTLELNKSDARWG